MAALQEPLNKGEVEEDDIEVILSTPLSDKKDKEVTANVPALSKCRAPVYKLFDWDDSAKQWKCKLCKSSFQHHKHSGSTVLNTHAKSKHPSEFKKLQQPGSSQTNLLSHVVKQKELPAAVTKDEVWSKVIQFIVETDQSYRLVEHPTFLDLISYVSRQNPNAEILKRTAVKEGLSKKYTQEKESLKKELESNLGKISLIVDCWTSSNQYAFQGVLATWVDNDWNMQVLPLDLTIIDGPHTGENLAKELGEVVTEFGLWKKLLSVTTDNAKNMDTMFTNFQSLALENGSEFSTVDFRVRCLAHIINLACKSIIKVVECSSAENSKFVAVDELDETGPGLISKLRSAINAIRGSPQRRRSFEKMCERLKCKHLVLMSDIKTRWNSTLDMLLRVREMKEAFIKTCQSIPELVRFSFPEEDWTYFDQLIEILKPFKEATYLISTDRPTLSDTTSVYQLLFSHLEKYIDGSKNGAGPSNSKRSRREETCSYPAWLIAAANEGWEKLKQYYPSSDGLVYIAATVMDPRLKMDWYKAIEWEPVWVRQAKRALVSLWENKYKLELPDERNTSTSPSCKKSEVTMEGDLFENMLNEKMKDYQKPEDELKQYLSEPVVPTKSLSSGILGWWKSNSDRFPKLSKMAKDVLSVHGTGVSVERFFSSAPDLLTARRQRLKPETIRETLVLKRWFKRKRSQEMSRDLVLLRLSKSVGDANYDSE